MLEHGPRQAYAVSPTTLDKNQMTTYAIGDIHGCLDSLEALLGVVPFNRHDQVVFLGDYIDRGPDSKGVVERLCCIINLPLVTQM